MITKQVFKTDRGWGYKILIDGEVKFIQNHAPAVAGLQGLTKEQADKLADMVIEKLDVEPNEFPTLSALEVETAL